jgi:DNA polymerase-3 subunit beta
MEILVRKADLVKELSLVQGIVERKNSIPILSNVLAEARSGELRIAATDLDVSLRCGCAAQVVAEGAITLGAKKLCEIARSRRTARCASRCFPTPGPPSNASG